MGIDLEWEVESDSGRDRVTDEARQSAAQKRRQTAQRRLWLGVALLLTSLVAAAFWRYRVVQDEKQRALIATVEAEALALRIGDKDKFMKLQGPAAEWRAAQRKRFDEFMLFADNLQVSGKILDLKLVGEEARVSVQVLLKNEAETAVWLYQYTDSGWRHTGTEAEPWTQQTYTSEAFTYYYYLPDYEFMMALHRTLISWWLMAHEMVGDVDPLELEITITPQSGEIEWGNEAQTMLMVPNPTGSARLSHTQRVKLAELLSERWATYALSEIEPRSQWFMRETTLLLQHSFDLESPSSAALQPLVDLYGPELLPTTLNQVRAGSVPEQALRDAISKANYEANPDPQGDALLAYLTTALRAEVAFAGSGMAPSRLPLIFMESSSDNSSVQYKYILESFLYRAPHETIAVTDSFVFNDVLWARTEFWGTHYGGSSMDMVFYMPFRKLDGQWVHTWPQDTDWGNTIIEEGDYITFTFRDLDADLVSGLHAELEVLYREMGAALAIEPLEPITIELLPEVESASNNFQRIRLASYYSGGICCIFDDAETGTRQWLTMTLFSAVFNDVVGTQQPTWNPIRYELQERVGEPLGLFFPYTPQVNPVADADLINTLEDLWRPHPSTTSDAKTLFEQIAINIGVEVLVDLLLETYGDEALGALVRGLSAKSTDEWLYRSVGIHAHDIEAEWQERFYRKLADYGYHPSE